MQTGALRKVVTPADICIKPGKGAGTTALPARRGAGIQNTEFCQEVRKAITPSLPAIVPR